MVVGLGPKHGVYRRRDQKSNPIRPDWGARPTILRPVRRDGDLVSQRYNGADELHLPLYASPAPLAAFVRGRCHIRHHLDVPIPPVRRSGAEQGFASIQHVLPRLPGPTHVHLGIPTDHSVWGRGVRVQQDGHGQRFGCFARLRQGPSFPRGTRTDSGRRCDDRVLRTQHLLHARCLPRLQRPAI